MKFYKEEWFAALLLSAAFFSIALAGAANLGKPVSFAFLEIGAVFSVLFALAAYRDFPFRHVDRFLRGYDNAD